MALSEPAAPPSPHRGTISLGPGDVLVLRALGLGDALAGVAALRGVRRAWPGRRLVLAAPAGIGGWLRDLGVVDAVIDATGLDEPLAVSGGGHLAVNLHGRGPRSHRRLQETNPAALVAFACPAAGATELPAPPSGAPDDRPTPAPEWRADEHEVARWCRLVRAAGGPCDPQDLRLPDVRPQGGGHVVLHPGAASAARRWPAERWGQLARQLAHQLAPPGAEVLVTGSAAERGLCELVVAGALGDADRDAARRGAAGRGTTRRGATAVRSVAGELDLANLTSLVSGARLLVCGDTGLAHLATAVGTPSVLLFGPVSPGLWGPAIDTDRHVVLWHGDGRGDPHGSRIDPSLAAISVPEVWRASLALLDRAQACTASRR